MVMTGATPCQSMAKQWRSQPTSTFHFLQRERQRMLEIYGIGWKEGKARMGRGKATLIPFEIHATADSRSRLRALATNVAQRTLIVP